VTAWLPLVRAQDAAVETLRRALASGRVHHAYRFDGPDGVGKELAAFGLAQALVCERRSEGSADACGVCRACIRAVPKEGAAVPLHPDIVPIERGLYDPAAIGRRTPEAQDISIDQIRTLVLARAAFPPHEGRAKVFIVRRADELSVPAANALLKTLEEPGAKSHFVLLTSAPDALLPTVLSRTQRVRFGPLPESVIADLLARRGVPEDRAKSLARLSAGSMANALLLDDPDASAARDHFVTSALDALDARDAGAALAVAEDAKKVSKTVLTSQIQALAGALGERGRMLTSKADAGCDLAAARYVLALAAIREIEANASVQLAMEAMLLRMRAVG
jgi:DNA polymerase-3 subunit delta'